MTRLITSTKKPTNTIAIDHNRYSATAPLRRREGFIDIYKQQCKYRRKHNRTCKTRFMGQIARNFFLLLKFY